MGIINIPAILLNKLKQSSVPVTGLRVGVLTDPATWQISFGPAATAEQRAAAQAILAAFDPAAEEAKAKAQAEADAKAAPYRELAVLKLAKAEAVTAGDKTVEEYFADKIAAIPKATP